MIVLTIRTDKPEAEIGLYDESTQLAYEAWQAHRQLGETLHTKIAALLESQEKSWDDIEGIAVYEGPGSFTGLRIGMSVANALAYSLDVPILATDGEAWRETAIANLQRGSNASFAVPNYGSDAHITVPKK